MLTRGRATNDRKSRRQPVPNKALAYIGAVVAAAVGLALFAGTSAPEIRVPAQIPWPLIAFALAGLGALPVQFYMFHKDDHTISLNLVGLPVIVGAIFTSPSGFVLAMVVAQLFTVVRRRDPLVRAAFNLANQVSAAVACRLLVSAVLWHGAPVSLRGWGALILALITYELQTDLIVLGVVTLTAGRPGKHHVKSMALHMALLVPMNAALSIIAVTVAWTDPWALLLMTGAGLLLALWYRSSNTVRSRYSNLQQLYDFTVKLSGLSESDQVLQVALTESCRTLHSHHAELCVPVSGQGMRYGLDAEGNLVKETVELSGVQRQVIRTREALLVTRDRRDKSPSARPFSDLMAVPLKLGDDDIGVLLVADRQGEGTTFDSEDLRLFEALAANLGTALTSSGRLDQLRSEVAAREHQALHDGLTGLANRTLFKHWVSTALARRKSAHLVAVMLMDLDGFKEINDTLGHHTGDALLKETATRLLDAVGPDQLAARLGGDEFAFVIPAAKGPEEVMASARRILEAVSQPIAVDGLMLSLRASIGVAMAPQHGADPSNLLKRADVAMYVAKNNHRGVMAYDPEIDHNTTRKLILGSELSQAIESGDLEVWYMPVAHLRSGQTSGFEALLRWRHDHYGPVSPNEFIPVAEQTGLIAPLTWWVLRESLGEVKRWREEGHELTVSVNVSARSLLDTEIVERLSDLIDDAGVSPSSLVIEITESSMMVEPDRSEAILRRISDLGIKIAIDDFGTGYSSLSRLKRMPVQMVKIDRSFVMNMCADDGDDAIVRATIELARNMGHTVIAEGVEDRDIWDRLLELGCHQAQGYYLSRAMPASECLNWLEDRHPNHLAPIRVLRGLAHGA